ncbi:MAG: hypothetical protein RLZZ301_392 [Bacteroidota bacterium]|jgi:hypothetical protein
MRALLLFLLLGLSSLSFSQSDYSKFDANIQFGGMYRQKMLLPNWGFQGEYHLNSHWSLLFNYSIYLMDSTSGCIHIPMGMAVMPKVTGFLVSTSYTLGGVTSSILIGALVALIPEGIAYHYPLKYRWDLAAFANPFGISFYSASNSSEFQKLYDPSTGVKLTYYSRFGIHANVFAQTRFISQFGVYPDAGVGIGYSFGHRRLGEKSVE